VLGRKGPSCATRNTRVSQTGIRRRYRWSILLLQGTDRHGIALRLISTAPTKRTSSANHRRAFETNKKSLDCSWPLRGFLAKPPRTRSTRRWIGGFEYGGDGYQTTGLFSAVIRWCAVAYGDGRVEFVSEILRLISIRRQPRSQAQTTREIPVLAGLNRDALEKCSAELFTSDHEQQGKA